MATDFLEENNSNIQLDPGQISYSEQKRYGCIAIYRTAPLKQKKILILFFQLKV